MPLTKSLKGFKIITIAFLKLFQRMSSTQDYFKTKKLHEKYIFKKSKDLSFENFIIVFFVPHSDNI